MRAQEQEEIWLMGIFLRLYSNSYFRIIAKQESPDFIGVLNNQKIGIEITEVFQDSNIGWSKLQQSSSEAASFTDQLINELQPFIEFTFSIGIHFNRFNPIKKSTKNQLIQKVNEICIPAISNLQDKHHIKIDHHYELPKEIDRIYISRYDNMQRSINSMPEGGGVGDLKLDHIKPILLKKEQKIRSYDPCSSYWLLIREGNYYAGSFDEVKIETPIGSLFDKVFLIRTRTEELIELK